MMPCCWGNKIISMIKAETESEGRKKIGRYSYASKDVIGKGYSSVVYKGINETNGTPLSIQDKPSL